MFALENLQQSKEAKEACVQVTLASEWLFLGMITCQSFSICFTKNQRQYYSDLIFRWEN